MIISCSGAHAFGQSHWWPVSRLVVNATPPVWRIREWRSDWTARRACLGSCAPAHNGSQLEADVASASCGASAALVDVDPLPAGSAPHELVHRAPPRLARARTSAAPRVARHEAQLLQVALEAVHDRIEVDGEYLRRPRRVERDAVLEPPRREVPAGLRGRRDLRVHAPPLGGGVADAGPPPMSWR